MLSRLVIHNVVLIDKLAIDLTAGLNVFTGETGAGKSILLDALGLALGGRSDAGLIRHGTEQASITAEFNLDDNPEAIAATNHLAEEQGLTIEQPLILRRVIGKDGKSRAFLNDQPISIGLLKKIGEQLLEIHGQFETLGLLNPAIHRSLLDSYASVLPQKQRTQASFVAWRDAIIAHKTALADQRRAVEEEDYLRAAVAELQDMLPEAGEVDRLAVERTALQNREKIMDALQSADKALNGDKGALAALHNASKSLAKIMDKTDLAEMLAALDRAMDGASDAANLLNRTMSRMDDAPDALRKIEDRLFALRAVARKHGVTVDELPQLYTTLSQRLALITDSADQVAKLARLAKEQREAYMAAASTLSDKRKAAAAKMAKTVMQELTPLKLERAQFFVEVKSLEEADWSADGMDDIKFLAATNAGQPAGAIHKVASGGELARFMLALKLVLADSAPIATLVFDEVDTGIGGATASAVGERLARLAEHTQVLVITHSPQVAARGQHHARVAKQQRGHQMTTSVTILSAEERREEIARMLAGTQITDAARDAAGSLLEDSVPASRINKRMRSS